jgi:hypothetical protein
MQSELIDNLKAYLPKLNEILSMSLKNPQSYYNLCNIKYNWTTNYHTSYLKNSHTIKHIWKINLKCLLKPNLYLKKRFIIILFLFK